MGFRVVRPDDFVWLERPHEAGEPARHVAELSALAGLAHGRPVRRLDEVKAAKRAIVKYGFEEHPDLQASRSPVAAEAPKGV